MYFVMVKSAYNYLKKLPVKTWIGSTWHLSSVHEHLINYLEALPIQNISQEPLDKLKV